MSTNNIPISMKTWSTDLYDIVYILRRQSIIL